MSMARLRIDHDEIGDFCQRWQISEFALFGPVLGPDFGPESAVDVLVTFVPEARHGLFQFVRIQAELEKLFGRKVDLISRRGLASSRNFLRRRMILSSAEVIYVA